MHPFGETQNKELVAVGGTPEGRARLSVKAGLSEIWDRPFNTVTPSRVSLALNPGYSFH